MNKGMKVKKKGYSKGGLKKAPNKGAAALPKEVRNRMGFMNKGGMPKKKKGYAMGGMTKKGYAMGGMTKKKKGYAKGGLCGASNPAKNPINRGKS